MDSQAFDAYLKQIQQIAQRLPTDPSALLDIMQVIERYRLLVDANPKDWEEFFKGESTFYSGQYEKALQHYLTAKGVPHYHFFCFRTSCFVARARGNQEQAVSFAKKALKLNPYDEILKQFLHDLNAIAVPKPAENIPKIHIGEKEMAELASIFEKAPQQDSELFSAEIKPERSADHPQASSLMAEKAQVSRQEKASLMLDDVPLVPTDASHEEPMETSPATLSFQQTSGQETLAQRLYALGGKEEALPETPLSTLKRLAEEAPASAFAEAASLTRSSDIESRIESFHRLQAARLQEYLDYTSKRSPVADNALFILSGWEKDLSLRVESTQQVNTQGLLLTERARKASSGLFLRWHGKGVAINPGAGFLNHFHEQGFSLQDIHVVIVTRDHYSAYADVKAIYELNNNLNKLGGQLQIIHYYLNQRSYQELTSILKPNFKQARNTVHSLELFLDSPDVEKTEIDEHIVLHYFLASSSEHLYKQTQTKSEQPARSTLGIRLELKDPSGCSSPVRLGYLSGASWSPLFAHHIGVCETVVAGFGNTSPSDYTKTGYQEDSLGYHGAYSLVEETAPKLFICTEFGGREGDIRIEAVKKLREEAASCGRKALQETAILPGDIGLNIDLKSLNIQCSVTQSYIDPKKIRIAKSSDAFGRLLYLSPSCYL